MKPVPPHLLTSKILLVDDNQVNLDLLDMVLGIAGFCDVDAISDPTKVMAMQQAKSYDLIMTDLRMPVMDGFAVVEALRESETSSVLPILVITAQTDTESRLRALELGASDFLLKPFDKTEVLNRVVNMLTTRWLYLKQIDINQQLEEKVAARTRDLSETTAYVISSLGRAAEFRDNETGMHVIRMSHFCARMAQELGHDSKAVELLKQASTMHDVGKIGIPDHILLKPGPLDEQEFEIMKGHASIGAEILSGSDSELLVLARVIAETHHEKWDGSGYPMGLSGEDIPLAGRIVALCDVFDALTSERPYKKAWSTEEAVAHIQRSAGSHFDPALVEVFSVILPDILELRERYREPMDADHSAQVA